MSQQIVVALPEAVRFVADENHHTIAAVKAASAWITQWTAPNNFPAFVGPRAGTSRTHGVPEGAIASWRIRFENSLRSALPEHPSLRACDFPFYVRVSEVGKDGEFWPGNTVCFQL